MVRPLCLELCFGVTDVSGTRLVTSPDLQTHGWKLSISGDALRKPKKGGQGLTNYVYFKSLIVADFFKFESNGI